MRLDWPSPRLHWPAGSPSQPEFLTEAELQGRERDNLLLVLEAAKHLWVHTETVLLRALAIERLFFGRSTFRTFPVSPF